VSKYKLQEMPFTNIAMITLDNRQRVEFSKVFTKALIMKSVNTRCWIGDNLIDACERRETLADRVTMVYYSTQPATITPETDTSFPISLFKEIKDLSMPQFRIFQRVYNRETSHPWSMCVCEPCKLSRVMFAATGKYDADRKGA